MPETLLRFFENYRLAWSALAPEDIADYYLMPCAIDDRGGAQSFSSKAALMAKFQSDCAYFQEAGVVHISAKPGLFQPLGPKAVSLDQGWELQTHSAPIVFRALYICHGTADGWRIFAAQAYRT